MTELNGDPDASTPVVVKENGVDTFETGNPVELKGTMELGDVPEAGKDGTVDDDGVFWTERGEVPGDEETPTMVIGNSDSSIPVLVAIEMIEMSDEDAMRLVIKLPAESVGTLVVDMTDEPGEPDAPEEVRRSEVDMLLLDGGSTEDIEDNGVVMTLLSELSTVLVLRAVRDGD